MSLDLSAGAPAPSALPQPVNRDHTVSDLTDAYLTAYAGRDNSRARYLREWAAAIGTLRLSQLDADVVGDTLQLLAEKPAQRFVGHAEDGTPIYRTIGRRSPATINRIRAALGSLLTWARRTRRAPRGFTNPVRDTEALRENNARTRFLSPAERDALLKLARVSSWSRLSLFLLLALTTGARRGELLGLRYRDLDLEQGVAYLGRTKNGQPRTLVLLPGVLAEIARHGKAPSPDALLFPSKYKAHKPMAIDKPFRQALQEAGIRDFRVHDLRHTAASYLAQSGASLIEIADVLGHQTLDVTRRYSHLTVDNRRQLVTRVLGGIAC
jgi:integrase